MEVSSNPFGDCRILVIQLVVTLQHLALKSPTEIDHNNFSEEMGVNKKKVNKLSSNYFSNA